MTRLEEFDAALAACPLIAILRGLEPQNALAVADCLMEAGFTFIEVPLNSPDPFTSIAALTQHCAGRAMIGAGTVTSTDQVAELARTGAALAISPHTDAAVIRASRDAGLFSMPGVQTASEAYAAINAGAQALKLFPMEVIGLAGFKALRVVLPKGQRLIAVGGVAEKTLPALLEAGFHGFGVGSALFTPTKRIEEVAAAARGMVRALKEAQGAAFC
ncbi:2-dehydro-3-deoxy-6-phosphogalactonate aldolase [Radicibacter daui]|uniref:2-dehydro-3-deoxy-6-phosphogalactonate aldolase n=1 Tax=Radicibacter daui TaxID=3064829 RepID=UPI004046EB7D